MAFQFFGALFASVRVRHRQDRQATAQGRATASIGVSAGDAAAEVKGSLGGEAAGQADVASQTETSGSVSIN